MAANVYDHDLPTLPGLMNTDKSSTLTMSKPSGARMACTLCRQRKLRCNRETPCSNCTKAGVQCVPVSTQRRERKRRFAERELLDRIHKYEVLLAQNNIEFEPLHGSLRDVPRVFSKDERDGEASMSSPASQPEGASESKNVWHTMSRGFRGADNDSDSSEDEIRASTIKQEWEQFPEDSDHLLFSLPRGTIDLVPLHPAPARIFKLWQAYLDNVDPMLKVTHIPSLQGRVVEAASDTSNLDPVLEALMFGIYCISVLSLAEDECQRILAAPKQDLLPQYQLGCQQALWNCKFLRSNFRDSLTAFLLYLISIRPNATPQSLSCMLGVAVRIAQRMGIHNESALAKLSPFEREMSRRLWWALALFDTRISGTAGITSTTLDPTWGCQVPLNVNDSELWTHMKEPPSIVPGTWKTSEAIFIVVRSEVADFLRHTTVHLDFTNPILKAIAKPSSSVPPGQSAVAKLEEIIESQYLKFCDPENALHFMILWSTRAFIVKFLLLECQSQGSKDSTDTQRDTMTAHAIRMLQCDSHVMTSPLTRRFIWLNHAYFPFPAFIHITQDLRLRPRQGLATRAWKAMSDSYDAWADQLRSDGPVSRIFAKLVLSAWESSERALREAGEGVSVPGIVQAVSRMKEDTATPQSTSYESVKHAATNEYMPGFDQSVPAQSTPSYGVPYSNGNQNCYDMLQPGMQFGTLEQDLQMDWSMLEGLPGWSYG